MSDHIKLPDDPRAALGKIAGYWQTPEYLDGLEDIARECERNTGMGGHQGPMEKDEWLTPPAILAALGTFDLDPCAPIERPWPTAAKHYTVHDEGLSLPWEGRVWLNPPYGPHTGTWLERLREHGDGIALIFARTETEVWFSHIWGKADAVLFVQGRLHFHHVTGKRAAHNAGAPSALVAYGEGNASILKRCGIAGRVIFDP